jgi:hypothetical protein
MAPRSVSIVRRHGGAEILRPSLARPIRPSRGGTLQLHRTAAYAVPSRCGIGDPRVVPGFRWPFLVGMPLAMTPRSSIIV